MIELIRFDAAPGIRLEERRKLQSQATGPHVILETCDRLELYRGEGQPRRELMAHLAAVAAGLKSPLPGEKAVQGQVKTAYIQAQAAETLSTGLHGLFQQALGIAKHIRSHAAIDHGSITHAGAVAQLLRDRNLADISEGILLLGVNELNESILRFLAGHKTSNLILTNRNQDKARDLALDFGARWGNLDSLEQELSNCRVVISCTAAPHYIIRPEHLQGRRGQPVLIFDLAAPPDVQPEVATLPGVEVLGLQAVESLMQEHLKDRHALLPQAFAMLEHELDRWESRQEARTAFLAKAVQPAKQNG